MTVNCTILSMQTVQHSFKELTNYEETICLLNQGLMSDGYEIQATYHKVGLEVCEPVWAEWKWGWKTKLLSDNTSYCCAWSPKIPLWVFEFHSLVVEAREPIYTQEKGFWWGEGCNISSFLVLKYIGSYWLAKNQTQKKPQTDQKSLRKNKKRRVLRGLFIRRFGGR